MTLQLSILSGKKAGASWVARRFPVRIGRAPSNDLQFEEEGVWNEHLILDFSPTDGFVLQAQTNALVSLNGETVERSLLRNGDVLELGSLKLQFWLGDATQRGLQLREWFSWACILAVCLGQIILIYWLVRS